jgi:hypothetical protein
MIRVRYAQYNHLPQRKKKAGSEEPDLFDYDAIRMELELLFNKNNFSI